MRGRPYSGGPRNDWWREYYSKNKKRISSYHKRYAAKNRTQLREYQKQWRAKRRAELSKSPAMLAMRNPLLKGFSRT